MRDELTDKVQRLDDGMAAATLHTALDALLKEVRPEHNALDSVDEYQRNSHVCGGAVRKILLGGQ